jgi:DNA-directed RNA polymerase specialized sigma24 family protein
MTATAVLAPPVRRDTVWAPGSAARKASMGASIEVGDLARAAAAGDPHGWNGLVERFGALVWSTARAYGLGPDAGADAAQTTWLRLAEQLDRLQDQHDRLGVWLAATARRESLRLLRAGGAEEAVAPYPAMRAEPSGHEREAQLWRLVRDLPEDCRRLLRILSTVPAPSQEEMAAALDLPVARVPAARAACLRDFHHRMATIGIKADADDS